MCSKTSGCDVKRRAIKCKCKCNNTSEYSYTLLTQNRLYLPLYKNITAHICHFTNTSLCCRSKFKKAYTYYLFTIQLTYYVKPVQVRIQIAFLQYPFKCQARSNPERPGPQNIIVNLCYHLPSYLVLSKWRIVHLLW